MSLESKIIRTATSKQWRLEASRHTRPQSGRRDPGNPTTEDPAPAQGLVDMGRYLSVPERQLQSALFWACEKQNTISRVR